MRNLCLILKIRFDELLGISAVRYEKNEKKKKWNGIHQGVMLILLLFAMLVVYGISVDLADAGLAEMLPVLAYVLGSMISLIVTILKMNETLAGNADAQFLMSMPISSVIQVIAMFLMLYLWNTLYTLIVALPMGIVYGVSTGATGSFWGLWILGIFLTSLPASGIAALLGMVIAVFLTTSRNGNQIHSVISLGFLGAIVALFIHIVLNLGEVLKSGTSLSGSEICKEMITRITSDYKLARFYQHGIIEGQPLWIFLFILMSVIWYGFFVFFLTMSYQELILALQTPINYKEYHWKSLEQQELKKALFQREVQQWARSKSYMVHSLLGMIVALIVSITVAVKGIIPLAVMFGMEDQISKIEMCIPLFLCILVGMSCTSYCSMSIEGRRHWIIETLPMDDSMLYHGKIKLNLIITIPATIVSAILMIVAFRQTIRIGWMFLFLVIPVCYACLSAWWGIQIEKRYADYSSELEQQVMSQSLSFFLGYLPQIVLPLLLMVGMLFVL